MLKLSRRTFTNPLYFRVISKKVDLRLPLRKKYTQIIDLQKPNHSLRMTSNTNNPENSMSTSAGRYENKDHE